MNQRKRFVTLLLVLILVGCGRERPSPPPPVTGIEETPAATETATSSPAPPMEAKATALTSTPLPSSTLTPTYTDAPPSETPTITPTPMPLPITQAISRCVPLEPTLAPGFLSPGNIVVSKFDDNPDNGQELFTISTNDFQPHVFGENLPTLGGIEGKISPDGRMFLYEKGSERFTKSVVVSASGELISTLPFCGPSYWLDNDRIACMYSRDDEFHVDVTHLTYPLASNQTQQNTFELPNIWRSEGLMGFVPRFDSTLTRVIYPQEDASGRNTAALWDLEKNQTLWSIKSGWRDPPQWSPDSSLLAIDDRLDDRYDLFLVNRDGQAQQWLELSGYSYPFAQLTWSPNGRYLAITFNHYIGGPTTGHLLYVLDTQEGSLVEYCGLLSSEYETPDVYWSPDSKQIIVAQWVSVPINKPLQTVTFVLDIENQRAARLEIEGMPDALILGWLVDPDIPTPTPLPPTATPLPTSTPLPGTVNEVDSAALVRIPAGPFTMGADPGSTDFWGAEAPAHSITLSEFRIYQNEVTNAMYQACIAAGACPPLAKTASRTQPSYFNDAAFVNYPVINVSHDAATVYCQWAGGRLPTEAEWEKAARGDDGRLYPWGNDPLDATRANSCDANCPAEHANTDLNDGYADTAPVGSFSQGASPYGVGDMAGNVLEWVADWFQADYYATSPTENPAGPESGTKRVVRGGSWYNDASAMRAAARSSLNPVDGYDTVGFRCVVP